MFIMYVLLYTNKKLAGLINYFKHHLIFISSSLISKPQCDKASELVLSLILFGLVESGFV